MTKPVVAFRNFTNAPKNTDTQFCHSIVTCFCLWLYHPVVRRISSAHSIICLYSIYLSRVCVSWQASKGYSNKPVRWKPSPSRRVSEWVRERVHARFMKTIKLPSKGTGYRNDHWLLHIRSRKSPQSGSSVHWITARLEQRGECRYGKKRNDKKVWTAGSENGWCKVSNNKSTNIAWKLLAIMLHHLPSQT